MTCRPCQERRKRYQAKLAEKKLKKQRIQAAAIEAVLAVTEIGGKVLGLNGEEDQDGTQPARQSVGGQE